MLLTPHISHDHSLFIADVFRVAHAHLPPKNIIKRSRRVRASRSCARRRVGGHEGGRHLFVMVLRDYSYEINGEREHLLHALSRDHLWNERIPHAQPPLRVRTQKYTPCRHARTPSHTRFYTDALTRDASSHAGTAPHKLERILPSTRYYTKRK